MPTLDTLQAQIDELRQRIKPKQSAGNPFVQLRLKHDEKAALFVAANAAGCSVPDFIRHALEPAISAITGNPVVGNPIPPSFLARTHPKRTGDTDVDRQAVRDALASRKADIANDDARHSRSQVRHLVDGEEAKSAIPVNPGAETVPKASRKGISGMKER